MKPHERLIMEQYAQEQGYWYSFDMYRYSHYTVNVVWM